MGAGPSSSAGISYGNGSDMFKLDSNPLTLLGPYSVNQEDMLMNTRSYTQNYYYMDFGMPYMRCAMFKRSLDYCIAERFDYSASQSEGGRCALEREDYFNCFFHGKEFRFNTIWTQIHSKEEGERQFCKFMNNFEKSHYDRDGGSIIERAKNVQQWYNERGLKGPKWQGGWD
eukprot:TRINITY_DN2094_c1_g5_i1.p1 TRINITY_DN2094_c1_g5~~TRINITY_DN2094_c1_g5_i1.p1  ORF type:complete len:172 (+),score=59.71 TRINITY_DN2094_c1_g5_i1:76-591(+)